MVRRFATASSWPSTWASGRAPIVDQDTGAVLGYHRGFWFHTIGQRKGVRC